MSVLPTSLDMLVVSAEEGSENVRLLAPEVGAFTNAAPEGRLVTPGTPVGCIRTLDRTVTLLVPPGVAGRVSNDRPERIHAPVGYGDVLYEIAPLDAALPEVLASGADAGVGGNVRRAPIAGRFWHRTGPGEPPLSEPGKILTEGEPYGLIEVMKTFSQVVYRADDGLPARARVVRLIAGDGVEVEEGEPLLEVEPA